MFIGTNKKGVVVLTKKDFDELINCIYRTGVELDYINMSISALLHDSRFDDITKNRIEYIGVSANESLKRINMAQSIIRKGC